MSADVINDAKVTW